MKYKNNWRIHEICKTCIYRETAGWSVNVSNDWANTCCTYALVTDAFIDRKLVTDSFCPCFCKASKKPKKYALKSTGYN